MPYPYWIKKKGKNYTHNVYMYGNFEVSVFGITVFDGSKLGNNNNNTLLL